MDGLQEGNKRDRVTGKIERSEALNERRSLALSLVAEAVNQLPTDHAMTLGWQLGLSGETLDVATIAGRLLLPEWRVDQLIYEAAVELGWALVCAEHDRHSVKEVAA
jgi:hypothetical protein